MKKLTKVEKFLLENEGVNYKSYRCPVHGVFQVPKSKDCGGKCGWPQCGRDAEFIEDAKSYASGK